MATPILEAIDVWRSYQRGSETIHALAGMHLTVQPGEMVGIVGRSGSGKTTFLNQVGCLDTPTKGTISICGTDVTAMLEKELVAFRRDHIGFIFQLFYLIPTLTAVENVELPMTFAREGNRRERALEALARVGLSEVRALPHQLNGGDMQRVAIARALVRKPRLLLADEPTGRLEHGSRVAIMDIFRSLRAEGMGIIIVTHDPTLAEETDRIIELRDGRVVDERKVA
ncbi:MAG: Macrolide export ATP-binding/permease protein MacB [bacterium ADurb.Bin429]|nr:MAG: Macrolide export ATP-binding/permease protein MacB [bacterium ADurb.Bin429]